MREAGKPPTARAWREQRQREAQGILEQLPDIPDAEFTLSWDLELVADSKERNWIIRYRDRVIYREPARHEDYHRYEVLAALLRQKYGSRVRDLVPMENDDVAYYLYGDFLGAVSRVEAARKRNFGPASPQ
jgi:hypothetical protein